MINDYEQACENTEMNGLEPAEIRRYFDKEKKRLKRRREALKKYNIEIYSISGPVRNGKFGADDEIPDFESDPEEIVIHRMDLERLRIAKAEMDEDDQAFLNLCYGEEKHTDIWVAEHLGVSRYVVEYRKKKLLKELRRKLSE